VVQINEAIEDVFRGFGISDVSAILESEEKQIRVQICFILY
jgi:hypothetical protein